ncbi:MAG: amino acid ABC transporter permease [Oscillospiraceae bacterium]|nr:amino acid ABC transporter permease [Oscillospiraceae bacterium]MCR5173369.1 amino acid ABC transporter permease [Oscillospiraceae bacterium]
MTIQQMLAAMLPGMGRSFAIFFLTLFGSLILGVLVALVRKSRFAVVRGVIKVYIDIMRGTPLMLQLLVWYFGPYYLFGWSIKGWRFPAIILGFVLNYAAYFCEIYRSGIESMPVGQYEAADVLGYTRSQTFLKIIFPQVFKRILPAVTNEVITLVKDTSLAFTLAYSELFSIAKQISAAKTSFMPFVIAGVFYFVANYLVTFGMERLEKAFSYYK